MEWKKVDYPLQDDWEIQIDITAYYGMHNIGSIVKMKDEEIGWMSVIDGSMDFIDAKTEDEAKTEMKDKLRSHFEDEINYYQELSDMIEELN